MSSNPSKQYISVMEKGMNLADLTEGAGWIQNLNFYQNAWETRSGFGVVGIHDTQMLDTIGLTNHILDLGFVQICGVKSFTTSFGHIQTLILAKAKGNNAILLKQYFDVEEVEQAKVGYECTYWTVLVYDHTTQRFLEEPLYKKTTENQTSRDILNYPVNPTPMEVIADNTEVGGQHGALETSFFPYEDNNVLYETSSPSLNSNTPICFMKEYNGRLIFGNKEIGVWQYLPVIFNAERNKRVENYVEKDLSTGYSETSCIKKIIFGEPISEDISNDPLSVGFNYFRNSEIGTIIDIAVWQNRVVYLTEDKAILYSDNGVPNAIIDTNFDTVQSQLQVTGIEELNGKLVIFTELETFLCQPVDNNVLASSGRVIKISETIGCASSRSYIKQEGALWFSDKNGVYLTAGSADIQIVSPGLDKFFNNFISNPLTNYYTQYSNTNLSENQPTLTYQYNEPPQLIYDNVRKHVLCNYILLGITLVYNTEYKLWYIWSYKDVISFDDSGGLPQVAENNKMPSMFLSYANERLFGLFRDYQPIVSLQLVFEDSQDPDFTGRVYFSYPLYVLEYGRGGSLDRSNIGLEDKRKITSGYYKLELVENPSTPLSEVLYIPRFAVYFDKPEYVDSNFKFADGTTYSYQSDIFEQLYRGYRWSDDILWVPINIQLGDITPGSTAFVMPGGPTDITIQFRFDATMWQPAVYEDAGTWRVQFELPTERLLSESGYTTLLTNGTTGLSDPVGDTITITYSGSPLNMVAFTKNPFILIPFRRFRFPTSFNPSLYPLGINRFSLNITEGTAPLATNGFLIERRSPEDNDYLCYADVYVWDETYAISNTEAYQNEDENVQAVDWIYKTITIGDGKSVLKPRGAVFEMSSRGHADDIIGSQDWPYGLLNVLVSTNYKEYQSQYIDLDSNPDPNTPALNDGTQTAAQNFDADVNTNINTMWNNGMQEKTFNNAAVYGDATSDVGNLLIDDKIFTNIVTSDGTRGDRFSYIFFGNVRNKAEKLYFKSANIAYRVAGALRRWGRGNRE